MGQIIDATGDHRANVGHAGRDENKQTVYLVTSIIRCVADMDEMHRKIATEAMAFSGLATGFTCFSYLFLRDMGAPEFHAQWALYILWAYYWIGLYFSWRRYL